MRKLSLTSALRKLVIGTSIAKTDVTKTLRAKNRSFGAKNRAKSKKV